MFAACSHVSTPVLYVSRADMSIDLKKLLLFFTLFVAPAGMFYMPVSALGSLRTFYFGCLAINLYGIVRLRPYQLQEIAFLILALALMVASAGYGLLAFHPMIETAAEHPVIRALVIGNAMFGFYFIGNFITEIAEEIDVSRILDITFYGFMTVFVLGGTLYLLVSQGVVPASLYTHFVSLQQSGYGYLRLSPGTYPNEFGVLCSFFACYAFVKYAFESRAWTIAAAMLFVMGIFLTSTRTAYITFVIGFATIFVLFPSARFKARMLLLSLVGGFFVVLGLRFIGFDLIEVITVGYQAALNTDAGSLAKREDIWLAAIEHFNYVPGLGVGFESPTASYLHNLPLQMLYGLGLWGLLLLILLFVAFFVSTFRDSDAPVAWQSPITMLRFRLLRLVLLEHVVLFGLTNHNQAHFLTWFLFALFICNLKTAPDIAVSDDLPEASSPQGIGQARLPS